MNKLQFGPSYARLLHRWTTLGKQDSRTWREQQEYEALNRQLAAQEVRTVRGIVDDYEQARQLYEAGNLGPVEL